MLDPYENYGGGFNPLDQSEGSPSGWVLANGGDNMQVQGHQHLLCYGDPRQTVLSENYPVVARLCNPVFEWDIKDVILPGIDFHDKFEMWPNGDCKFIYPADHVKVRKHKCGWAMRNTNNHNKLILKKSCLGIIKCSRDCAYPDQHSRLALAPKISEGARRGQLNNKSCPNPECGGLLIQRPCRGKSGNPVTHYWRYNQSTNSIYFMAKGVHDHSKPLSVLKVTDRKVKLIKREAEDDMKIRYPLEGSEDIKRAGLTVDVGSWNDSLTTMSNESRNFANASNQCQTFSWATALDFVNLEMDRAIQPFQPDMSYIRPDYPNLPSYQSFEEPKVPSNSDYSSSYISEYSEHALSPGQDKSYPSFSSSRHTKYIPDFKKDQYVGEHHWSTGYGTSDILQLPSNNYYNEENEDDLRSRILFNDDLKLFNFYSE